MLTSLLSKSLKFCEIRKKFGENLIKICKICCLSCNSAKIASNSVKNGAKVLKNQRNLEWCKGKNVELEKRWKMRPWTQKSALIQPKTSLGKGLKNVYSKGLRWLYFSMAIYKRFATRRSPSIWKRWRFIRELLNSGLGTPHFRRTEWFTYYHSCEECVTERCTACKRLGVSFIHS